MTPPKCKNDLRTCILQAAAKLFSKLGLEKTSTRDISKESNANISLISYHFGGKEGLYKEVIKDFALKVQSQMTEFIQHFESKELTRESMQEEIKVMITMLIHVRLQHPEICKILSREKIEGMPICRDVHEDIFFPMVEKFISRVKLAQEKKIIRSDFEPALLFILISEGVWGFFELMDCHSSFETMLSSLKEKPELLIEQILNIYVKGVFYEV